MSGIIIQEPSSQRGDNNVWIWRYGDPVYTPVKVHLLRKDTDEVYVDVPTSYTVGFFVKADLRDDTPIIEKMFNFIEPSLFVVDIPTEEVILLRSGKCYHCGMALYDESGNFVRTLVADLPLCIDKSTLSNLVF